MISWPTRPRESDADESNDVRMSPRRLRSSKNSRRVRASVRNAPSIALVSANEFCFSTPRINMHRCVASTTTPTPNGSKMADTVSAI